MTHSIFALVSYASIVLGEVSGVAQPNGKTMTNSSPATALSTDQKLASDRTIGQIGNDPISRRPCA